MNGGSITSSLGLGTVPTAWAVEQVGDFDGDGKADILWRHTSGLLALWLMNGGSITSSLGLGAVPTSWAPQ